MKNTKGFTLIELLGVITILAIIALIAVPAISNSINSSRDNLKKIQAKQVENAAKSYYASPEHLKDLQNDRTIKVSDLIIEGLLPNEKTNKAFDDLGYSTATSYVTVKKIGDGYKYEITFEK